MTLPANLFPDDSMQLLGEIAFVICAFTGGLLALQSLGLVCTKPLTSTKLYGAGLYLALSVLVLSIGLGQEWFGERVPALYGFHILSYYLIGPLTRAYVWSAISDSPGSALGIAGQKPRLSRDRRLWLVLPAVLVVVPFALMPWEWKVLINSDSPVDTPLLVFRYVFFGIVYVGLLAMGSATVRMFLELRLQSSLRSGGGQPVLWHIRALLFWCAGMVPFAITSQYLDSAPMKRMVVSCLALAMLWLYILDFRYPRFFQQMRQEIRARTLERYQKSKIQKLDTRATIRAVEDAMQKGRLYADEDLSLERLAAAAGIQAAQLSELLNSVMGIDFRSYVNQFRVEAAKQMLVEELDRNILSVALAVGFTAKTSFNRNFKATVGRTPAQYRAEESQKRE